MNVFLIIYLILLAVADAVCIIYYAAVALNKKDWIDNNIVLNFNSNKSHKRFIGIVKKEEKGAEGRTKLYYEPKDVFVKEGEKVIANDEEVITEHRIILPKNSLSADKNIEFVLPSDVNDYDKNFLDTLIGKAFLWITEVENLRKTEIDLVRSGSISKTELLQKLGDGEISRELLSKIKSEIDLILTLAVKNKEDKKDGFPQRN